MLLSGGLDSATALAIAKTEGYLIHAISFNYGQRHVRELDAAKRIADWAQAAEHAVVTVDLQGIGGSALTAKIPVPKSRSMESDRSIPVTYVPARNTIFLSLALGLAEVRGASDIFIGVNALDYSGYPDCRPEFIRSFEELANLATKAGVSGKRIRIQAPLIHLSKSQIITRGLSLSVPYELTTSCYDPFSDGKSCGSCDACQLRQKGFHDAGLSDPALALNEPIQ